MFSTEKLATGISNDTVINSELAARFTTTETNNRREEFQERLEVVMVETMKKEADILTSLDNELIRLGFSLDVPVSIEPNEFLDFVLEDHNGHSIITKSREAFDRTRYKVTEDFSVSFNEMPSGETPRYVLLGRDELAFCSFLAQRGIDIVHAPEPVFRELIKGRALHEFSELVHIVYENKEEARTIIEEERDTYAADLKQELSAFTESLKSPDSPKIEVTKLHEIFNLYQHIPSRSKDEQYSLIPEFKELVVSKKNMTSENVAILNEFFENNEELILKVLGEDYFLNIQERHDDFEGAYKELFGYKSKELWERRHRNWENVNKYLIDEVAARGFLTVEDLRQIHALSTKGVLPFFCRGFRNDRNVGWYQAEHFKKTVTIGTLGGQVATTDVKDIESSLEILVSKANRVAKTKYPQVMADVALGNLFAEYAAIHPHPDGNGTNAVFFMEAIKVLDGKYIPPVRYEQGYKKRVANALNNNVLAIAVAYTRLTGYEVTHKNKRKKK